jgi:hypothetical protein
MAIPEIVIWSAMAGVLLCLVALAIVDALLRRRAASFRLAVFFVVATMTCILMSGLPEALWPLAHQELLPAKAVMGPLSAALALGCLVRWSALSLSLIHI